MSLPPTPLGGGELPYEKVGEAGGKI